MFQHFPATTSDNHINDQYPFLKVSSEHLDTHYTWYVDGQWEERKKNRSYVSKYTIIIRETDR